ncbi:MAG: hypothetical protein E7559_01455 [Ruminococcaceae bacterium]|nr:hypothetical protein [Oscillospiraceae bacterium]
MDKKAVKTKKHPQEGLSVPQLFALGIFSVGGGLLLWAGRVGSKPDTGWLPALAIAAVAAALLTAAVVYSFRRTGCRAVSELLGELFTSVPARCILLLLGIFLTARAAQTLSLYTGMTGRFLLPKTPSLVLAAAAVVTALVLMYDGLRSMARTAELLMLMSIIPAAVMLTAFLVRIDTAELLVLAQPRMGDIAPQLTPALYTFAGVECVIFFVGHGRGKGSRTVPLAVGASAIVSAVLFVGAVGILTLGGVQSSDYPFIETARMINIGGVNLTERFDILLILLRVLFIIVQTAVLLYCASISISSFFGREIRRRTAPVLCAVAVVASLLMDKALLDRICTVGLYGTLLGLIPAVFVLSLFHKKQKNGNEKSKKGRGAG